MNKKARELFKMYLDRYAPYEVDSYETLVNAKVEDIIYNFEVLKDEAEDNEEYEFIEMLLKELKEVLS